MLDLNDLLKSAQARVASNKAYAVDRAKLKDARLTDAQRDQIANKVRAWQSANEYVAIGLTFRCLHYVCKTCHSETLAGGQVLLKEKHARVAGTVRFIQAEAPFRQDLPRERDTTEVPVLTCPECAGTMGFGANS